MMSGHILSRRAFMNSAALAAAGLIVGKGAQGADAPDLSRARVNPATPFDRIMGYVPQINLAKDEYTIALWADPQMAGAQGDARGHPVNLPAELATISGRIRRVTEMTNSLRPDFVLVLGDVVHESGPKEYYERYIAATAGLKSPQYLLAGNHDFSDEQWLAGNYYTSPEGKEFFGTFRWAQRQLGGFDRMNYSFDAGRWHIIMFSVPGVGGSEQVAYLRKYPQHTAWLAEDLEAHKDKPTIFCTHPPLLPACRVAMDTYGPNARQRRELVEILTRHGNVKLCLSGHVHNTVTSIAQIAWRYKGACWLTLPTAAFDPREYDYRERNKSSYGFALLRIQGDELGPLVFYTLAGETIPVDLDALASYDHEHLTGLREDCELPAAPAILNGDFRQPLTEGWFLTPIIENDQPPLEAVRRIETVAEAGGDPARHSALWLMIGGMNDQTPRRTLVRFGHRIELKQAVTMPPGDTWPFLQFDYKMPRAHFTPGGRQCAYLFVSGHRRDDWTSNRNWHIDVPVETAPYRFRLQYALGTPVHNSYREQIGMFQSDPEFDVWRTVRLNIRRDLAAAYPALDWAAPGIDSVVITLGVWNLCQGRLPEERERVGVYLTNIVWAAGGAEDAASPFRLLTAAEVNAMNRMEAAAGGAAPQGARRRK